MTARFFNQSVLPERGTVSQIAGPGVPFAFGVFAAMLGIVLLLRHAMLGNPDFHVDEQFYFLVADRMWAGDLPYVDVWDRKPIGLFLIYAALRPLSGDSLIAVQLAGHVFTALTSLVIWDLSIRHLGRWKALLPAALYGVWMGAFGGANGQSPVFHNLFVAAAFWLLLRAWRDEKGGDATLAGVAAMALIGLAIQVKYTPIFPGLVVGLGFMWLEWTRRRQFYRLVVISATWVTVALLPTIVALAFYYARGHADEFIYANFVSIFYRARLDDQFLFGLKFYMLVRGLPLFIAAGAGLFVLLRSKISDSGDRLIIAWLAAEVVILIVIGNYYDHYALPLIAPLAILSGWLFLSVTPVKIALYLVVFFLGGVDSPEMTGRETKASREAIGGLAESARPYLKHGCMFIFDGPSILYTATQSCLLTRFAYPDHLSNQVEENAIGVDTHRELARVLEKRPAVIVTTNRALIPTWNKANRAMLDRTLGTDYRLVHYALMGSGYRHYLLWARADLVPPGQRLLRIPPSPGRSEKK